MQKRSKPEKQLKAPNLPTELQHNLPGGSIQDREYYVQLALTQTVLSGQTAKHVTLDQVLFKQVAFNNTCLPKVHVLDCRFSTCDLANAEWPESSLHRVELLGCHLTGFRAVEAVFQDTFFKECSSAFAQFAMAKFKMVRFEDCDLSEANFYEADLSGVTFLNCNLSNADFTRAKLVGADLRGSKIDGLRVGPTELKGATLDMTQAIAFIRGLGIKVSLNSQEA